MQLPGRIAPWARLRARPPFPIELVVASAIAVLSWPIRTIRATTGLDPSWVSALHLAHLRGVGFGPSFTWTYGPLGYLAFPVAVSAGTLVEAFAFAVVSQVALSLLLLRTASATFGFPAGAVLTFVVASLPIVRADILLLLLLLLALSALSHPATASARWFPVAGPALAAAALLFKTNVGGSAIGVALATPIALPGGPVRRLLVPLAVLATTFTALWLATGNAVSALPDWMRLSTQIVAGYSAAMQYEQPGTGWQHWAAAAAVLVLAVASFPFLRAIPRRRAVAAGLVLAGFAFASFKEGFVRHDNAHGPFFFAAVAVALLAVATGRVARWVAAGGIALMVVSVVVATGSPFTPAASAQRLVRQARTVADRDARSRLVAESEAAARAGYALTPQLLRALRGRTVHVDPWETALVAAYDLPWRPLPVVQSYSAYTASLDAQNARALAAGDAPARILRQNIELSVNGRNRELEAPATFRSLLCNYREVIATPAWQVLAHTARRCGRVRALGQVEAVSGTRVAIPLARADELVFARIDLPDPFVDRVLGLLYKPHQPGMSFGDSVEEPIVRATAADGIVLRVPPSAGFDPRYEGVRAWNTITVRGLTRHVRIRFFAVAVRGRFGRPRGIAPTAPLPRFRLSRRGSSLIGPDGRVLPIGQGGGFLDYAYVLAARLQLQGWAADVAGGRRARQLLVFADGRLVFGGKPDEARPDVATTLRRPSLLLTGYRVSLPASLVRRRGRHSVRVIALVGARALEVQYPAEYDWPP